MSTSTRHSRRSSAGLRWRAFAAAPVASVSLAVLVAGAALLAVAAPRVVEQLHTSALDARLNATSAYELDLQTATRDRPQLGPPSAPTTLSPDVDAVWGGQQERLIAMRDALPDPLRGTIGDPIALVTVNPQVAAVPGAAPSSPVYRIEIAADPHLAEHVALVDGAWPAVPTAPPPAPPAPTPQPGEFLFVDTTPEPLPEPLDLVLDADVADDLSWSAGEVREITAPNGTLAVRLTGTFEPADASAGLWSHLPTSLHASVVDDGLGPPEYTATAFIDPLAWPVIADQPLAITLSAWLPIDTGAIRSNDSTDLEAQVDEFESTGHALGDGSWTGNYATVGQVSFASGLPPHLAAQRAESTAVDAVLATVASGPIGVLVAVIVLGARVVFERRRAGLELAAARGASTAWLRGALGGEGLAIGVPAALVGGAVAIVLTSAQSAWGGWLVAAVFALAPAVLLTTAAPALTPLRRARADLGRRPSRLRWVWEALVIVVTAVAVGLLLARGPTAAGVDPLLAAVPLLIALSGCVVVLRCYPLPLAAVVRRAKAGRGLVAFLGSARALRDPSAGLVPVLAVVVGVAVAVSSAITLTTVRAGAASASDAAIGADASVAGVPLTKAQLEAMRSTPGVEAIAPVYSTSPVYLELDGRNRPTTFIVIDVAEVSAVQAGRDEVLDLPPELAREVGDDEPLPVLTSDSVAEQIADADRADIDDTELELLGTAAGRTAFSPRPNWILVDRVNAKPFTATLVPRTVLVRFDPDADAGAVTTALGEIAGPGASVRTPDELTADLLDRPNARGLETGLVLAIALTSLLTALALVLALVVGRPARERLLPLLATLGLRRRGERGLVAWELGPMTVAAVVVGAVLGIGMPHVVLAGIDLGSFTGGDRQPAITIDWALVAAVLAGAVVVAAAGAWAASTLGGRVGAARALRKEEEEG
ncbi:FtsX-like permease family protein [Agromyces intestinalis]|uniref:FtsX-like permease family protein n=1 Tax=Agromyces intestinalis TaxID=2592652 RepID=A0A5C1YI97_9MICO|nr:FtsX-like permease family protein [Agromyces intestinalis]QEO15245.1 FtsX-like permease family protein [Agromyces intestinalis]